MSLPEIQMLWVSGGLSTMERLAMTSFIRHGHPVRLFSYDDISHVPTGVQLEDARHIMAEQEVFTNPGFRGHGGLSIFSNFFRYRLLLARGGIWADADLVCIKPLAILEPMAHVFATEYPGASEVAQTSVRVQSCLIKAPANSPIIARALAIAESVDLESAQWLSTGPGAVHTAVVEANALNFALRPEFICPFGWWQVPEFVTARIDLIPVEAHTIHLYNEIWRRNFIDKDGVFDPLSLYERLKRHYLGGT